ncbi:MAG: C10 family peptidase [Bacteroides sp.]
MKRNIAVLLLSLCTLFSVTVWAAPISLQKAEVLANEHWKSVNHLRGGSSLTLLYTSSGALVRGANRDKDYYVFGNRKSVGYVIVAGDDALPSVLGYSINSHFDASQMPAELKAWLDGYAQWVQQVRKRGIKPTEQLLRAPDAAVAPLLGNLIWGQSWPYNNKTLGLTGCVATAMAQIMRYYAWPKRGRGVVKFVESEETLDLSTHTYAWEKMLNSYTSSSTPEQQEAVATLMHDFGRAAKMKYSHSGSGATSINAFTALIRNFDYSKTLRRVEQIHYSFRDWQALLLSELQAKRPVYYSGNTYDNQPHAFVCDGYDGKGYFHFNWGGNGNSDGFFALNALNIQELNHTNNSNPGYSFSVSDMIIGIQPSIRTPLDIYPLNFTCARFEIKAGSYSKSESVKCTVRGLENAAYPTVTLTAGLRVLDATGTTVKDIASTDVPETLESGQIIHLTDIQLSWADLPKGKYTVIPMAYIPSEKKFYTTRLNWRSPVFELTVSESQVEVKDVTPKPILKMEWLPKKLYSGVNNHCVLRVTNVGTRDYNAIIMALFSNSASVPSIEKLRYNDITYRATIRVSPGEMQEYCFDAFGPLANAKYVHFFYDKDNNEGTRLMKLTPGLGSGIVSPQYYPQDWVGMEEVELLDSYSFGEVSCKQGIQPTTLYQNEYLTSHFEFSVKDPAKGARLWLKVYLRQNNETKSSFDAGTVNLLPGEERKVSIPQIIKLAPGEYEYALHISVAENGNWKFLRYEKFNFTVLEGTSALPVPPNGSSEQKQKYTVYAPQVENAEGGSCIITRLDGQALNFGEKVEEGTFLKVEAVANAGWKIEKKELKGLVHIGEITYKVVGEVSVSIRFVKKEQETYAISIAQVENGIVTVSKKQAAEGEMVQISSSPSAGYRMKAGGLWVYKTEDKSVKVEVKDMKFTMPAYPVTVAVAFEKDNSGSAAVEDALYASIAIGPNPFVEELRIFVGLYNKATIEYKLYSAQGIVVRSGKLEREDASIETRSLPAGIYLLELSTQGGYTRTWKLIK